MLRYRLYGLQVASGCALAGLAPSGDDSAPEVVCHFGALPDGIDLSEVRAEQPIYTSQLKDSTGLPILQIWRFSRTGHCYFHHCEGLTFAIDRSGREIWARWSEGVTLEDVTAFLLHQVFGFILHLRGFVCIHASAVVIDGSAVLFAGDSGMGKSSTAAAFAEQGYPVLADDVSTTRMGPDGGLVVIPSVPGICLWPDSAEFLFGSGAAERFPRLQPREEKRLVRLDSELGQFQREPAPLGGVYLLAPRSTEWTAPRIEPLGLSESLIQLLTKGYVSGALDSEGRAREFQMQGEITRRVPVQRLVPSSDPRKLGRLCDLVVNDVRLAKLSLVASHR